MKSIFVLLSIFISIQLSSKTISLQKPKVYHGDENIKGWFMSEKLDGIRAYWNKKELITKNGNIINAPKWFLKQLPQFDLDGELWSKRGDFENIQSIVLDKISSEKWKEISYNIFEVPHKEGNFTQRLNYIKKWIKINRPTHLKVIPQYICMSKDHLNNFLNTLIKLGAEGIILKNPKLDYFTGRSKEILKVKKFYDMEGRVVKINRGKGKFKDIMGSLSIKLKNGVVFKLGNGFSFENRVKPPKLGSIVTFKYYGFTKNLKPKYASFMRIRKKE